MVVTTTEQPNYTIHSTKDYEQFKFIKGNRKLISSHLAKLAVSIFQKNMLEYNPIIVNEKFEVVDGQHRLEIAKNNNLEIYYVILENASIEDVMTFNEYTRIWNAVDFLNSYASRGKKSFVWLKSFLEDYTISLTTALAFIYGYDSGWTAKSIKKGTFEIDEKQKEVARVRADVLYSMRPYIKRSGAIPRAFLLELIHITDQGLAKKLIQGLKEKGTPFLPESSRKEAYEQLQKFVVFA